MGDSRDENGEISPGGHAWNAAQLNGHWYLMDVTWDSGNVNGPVFEKDFGTDYYLAPPKVFLLNHLPEQDDWQLQAPAMSRVEFVRQPMLEPKFFALGLRLVSPTHQQNDGGKQVSLQVNNPGRVKLAAVAKPAGAAVPGQCDRTTTDAAAKLTCALPAPGRYDVILFAFPPVGNTGESIASLQFSRPAE
ncbi:MAG: hypothetical protein HYU66_26645 [Armatimonadetes bacterium]|nr:hypothetical protein [Armatimonadota bacterium]